MLFSIMTELIRVPLTSSMTFAVLFILFMEGVPNEFQWSFKLDFPDD